MGFAGNRAGQQNPLSFHLWKWFRGLRPAAGQAFEPQVFNSFLCSTFEGKLMLWRNTSYGACEMLMKDWIGNSIGPLF